MNSTTSYKFTSAICVSLITNKLPSIQIRPVWPQFQASHCIYIVSRLLYEKSFASVPRAQKTETCSTRLSANVLKHSIYSIEQKTHYFFTKTDFTPLYWCFLFLTSISDIDRKYSHSLRYRDAELLFKLCPFWSFWSSDYKHWWVSSLSCRY